MSSVELNIHMVEKGDVLQLLVTGKPYDLKVLDTPVDLVHYLSTWTLEAPKELSSRGYLAIGRRQLEEMHAERQRHDATQADSRTPSEDARMRMLEGKVDAIVRTLDRVQSTQANLLGIREERSAENDLRREAMPEVDLGQPLVLYRLYAAHICGKLWHVRFEGHLANPGPVRVRWSKFTPVDLAEGRAYPTLLLSRQTPLYATSESQRKASKALFEKREKGGAE